MEPKQPKKVKTKSQKLCKYFKKGFCKSKERCRYSHKVEHCEDWLRSESDCKKQHCKDRHVVTCLFNSIDKCRFGPRCQYIHRKSPKNELRQELELIKEDNITLKQTIKDLTKLVSELKANMDQIKGKEMEIEVVAQKMYVTKEDVANIVKGKVISIMEEQKAIIEEVIEKEKEGRERDNMEWREREERRRKHNEKWWEKEKAEVKKRKEQDKADLEYIVEAIVEEKMVSCQKLTGIIQADIENIVEEKVEEKNRGLEDRMARNEEQIMQLQMESEMERACSNRNSR